MARTNGKLISQGEQTRYSTNVIKALGLREDNEIMKWAQKTPGGISSTDLRQVVFYQILKDSNSVVDVDGAKYNSLGSDFDSTNGYFGQAKGFNGNEILRGVIATCSTLTSTFYVGEREYSKTMLNVNDAILDFQKSDMNEKLEGIFLDKLATLNAGTLTIKTQGGDLTNQGIAVGNVFGDDTVAFETGANLMDFRRMLARAKIKAGTQRQVFLLGGEDLLVLIETATRFINHDWANSATKKGGMANANEILSASREILNTPYMILVDFDTKFPRTGASTDKCLIFAITQNSYGFDRSKGVGKLLHIEHQRSIMFDMVIDYALEITDPIGFYKFKFKYGQPA